MELPPTQYRAIDAARAARATTGLPVEKLWEPRAGEQHAEMVSHLFSAQSFMKLWVDGWSAGGEDG